MDQLEERKHLHEACKCLREARKHHHEALSQQAHHSLRAVVTDSHRLVGAVQGTRSPRWAEVDCPFLLTQSLRYLV